MTAHTSSDPGITSHNRFAIDRGRPLEILAHNRGGSITIRGTERTDILVRANDGAGDDEIEGLIVEYANNRLEVRTEHRNSGRAIAKEARRAAREANRAAREATKEIFRRREGQIGRGGVIGSWQIDFDDHIKQELTNIFPVGIGGFTGSIDLTIEIPASGVDARVEAHTTSGDIRIAEVHGATDAATASGDIALLRVSGDMTAQSASGGISVSEPTGALRARSASGDVQIQGGSLEQYVFTTASGDISLRTTLIGEGPYRIDAVSGDVTLELDAPGHLLDRGCSIALQTVSGNLQVQGDARKINRRTWHYGPETDRTITLALRTVSGDATVSLDRRPDHSPAPQPARPPQAARPDDATRPIDSAWNVPPTPPTPPAAITPPTITQTSPHLIVPALPTPPVRPTAPKPATPASAPIPRGTAELHHPATEPTTADASPNLGERGDALSRLAAEMEETLSTKAATQQPSDDSRLAVLAALERGEIDIDEAMRRLDADPTT